MTRFDACLIRCDILAITLRQMIDDKHDRADLKRNTCACGSPTLAQECPNCRATRLRKELLK